VPGPRLSFTSTQAAWISPVRRWPAGACLHPQTPAPGLQPLHPGDPLFLTQTGITSAWRPRRFPLWPVFFKRGGLRGEGLPVRPHQGNNMAPARPAWFRGVGPDSCAGGDHQRWTTELYATGPFIDHSSTRGIGGDQPVPFQSWAGSSSWCQRRSSQRTEQDTLVIALDDNPGRLRRTMQGIRSDRS